jgi:hypothetical protein
MILSALFFNSGSNSQNEKARKWHRQERTAIAGPL